MTINTSDVSPTKDFVLRSLCAWHDDFTMDRGSKPIYTIIDWNNDKYKNSIILNNIHTLVYGYINEHQEEKDFKIKFDKFILSLIDEIKNLYV